MSKHSNRNSSSSEGGFFKRMLRSELGTCDEHVDVQQRHPGFSVSGESNDSGRSMKPVMESVVSEGIRELNKEGFVIYNVSDHDDIYISTEPDNVCFEDDGPIMIKMSSEEFDSPQASEAIVAIPAESEIDVRQASDIFANAEPRPDYGEINLDEIIVKEHYKCADVSLLELGNSSEFINGEQSMIKSEPEFAETSAGAVVDVPKADVICYEDSDDEINLEESVVVMSTQQLKSEVPEGLHLESNVPQNVVDVNMEGLVDVGSFDGTGTEAVITSEAVIMSASAKVDLEKLAIPESESRETFVKHEYFVPEFGTPYMKSLPAPVMVGPMAIEALEIKTTKAMKVDDIVADILKITIPGMCYADDLIAESEEAYVEIPDDGLEAYDAKFSVSNVKEAVVGDRSSNISFDFEGNKSVKNNGSNVNFTF